MCGLTGIYSRDTVREHKIAVESSITAMLHRGPDGIGFYSDNHITLGHCRLAFKGHSPVYPVMDSSNRFHIGLNGEIYNYVSLAKKYGISNSNIESGGDAKIVVELYKKLGEKCLTLLDGHFAFYIYDSLLKELHLFRDRFGSKPIYYVTIGGCFYFSSEIKSLPTPKDFNCELNLETLNLYFKTQNFYGSDTIFKNVLIMEPGQHLKVSQKGLEIDFFIDDTINRDLELSTESSIDAVEALLLESISSQWEHNIEMSGYLSGGVDSSLIAISANRLGLGYKTFTTEFSNSNFNESYDARALALKLGFQNTTTQLDESTFWAKVIGISKTVEEPRFGQCINNLVSMQTLSLGSKIALSGIGADELFGGYPWRYDYGDKPPKTISQLRNLLIEKQCRLTDLDLVVNADSEYSVHRLNEVVGHVVQLVKNEEMKNARVFAPLELDLRYWLPSLLVVEDKLSMSLGVETRMPFLTNDFWQLGRRLRVESMLTENNLLGDGKLPLRSLLNRWGFPEIASRPKQGFTAPDSVWFSDVIKMKNIFRRDNPIWDLLDRSLLQNIQSEHLRGTHNHRGLLWSIIYFDDLILNW